MFKFRPISILFIVSLLVVTTLVLVIQISWWWLVLPFIAYVFTLAAGSFCIQQNFFIDSLSVFSTSENIVYLTFDDGPSPDTTPEILDLLKEFNVRATFFCIGEKVKHHPLLVKRILEEGHAVGNHSYTHHSLFGFFSTRGVYHELCQTNDILTAITGMRPTLFRPPFGVTNPSISKAVKKADLHVIGWSVRSFDTVTKDSQRIFSRVRKQIKPGAIILMHDNCDQTIDALRLMLVYLKQNNYITSPISI